MDTKSIKDHLGIAIDIILGVAIAAFIIVLLLFIKSIISRRRDENSNGQNEEDIEMGNNNT